MSSCVFSDFLSLFTIFQLFQVKCLCREQKLLRCMKLAIRCAPFPFSSTFPVRLYWTLLGYRNIRNFRWRHRSGRARVTSCHVDKMMKRLCLQNPHITTSKIQAEIALIGNRVPSVSTIKRLLRNQYQLTACLPEFKPELIGNNDVPVCAFVENKHWTVAD